MALFVPSFSIQAENEMSIEDLIAKYGCGGGAEEVEDNVDESETEVEDEGMTFYFPGGIGCGILVVEHFVICCCGAFVNTH
jgi:hypothetical protein